MNRQVALMASAGLGMALLAACSDTKMGPETIATVKRVNLAVAGTVTGITATPVASEFRVCKEGNTAGTFTVTRTNAGGGSTGNTVVGANYVIQPGTCAVVVEDDSPSDFGSNVQVTETSAGLQSITGQRVSTVSGITNIVAPANGHTDFINSIHGVRLTFTNVVAQGCTLTQGFWKTHGPIPKGKNSNEWDLNTITLGTVNYTQLQALSIFNTPVGGNGLISLAHQLMAAKLNIANGANGGSIAATIAAADALIDGLVVPPVGSGFLDPSTTSALTGALAAFNEGVTGPGHCGDEVVD
jgi:hypothetical protein